MLVSNKLLKSIIPSFADVVRQRTISDVTQHDYADAAYSPFHEDIGWGILCMRSGPCASCWTLLNELTLVNGWYIVPQKSEPIINQIEWNKCLSVGINQYSINTIYDVVTKYVSVLR